MSIRIPPVFVFAAAIALAFYGRAAAAPVPPDSAAPSADDAAKTVQDDLARLKGEAAVVQQVKDDAVGRAFPKYVFFGAYFRQYPVARLVPEGLKASNLYAVGSDGKPQLIQDDGKQLGDFFLKNLGPAKEDDAAKDAARAYVRLTEELYQDGFYKFALQEDSTKVETGADGKMASARAMVTAGGNGQINASLTFDRTTGELQAALYIANLKEGPRPICQATKLLDADPIVRRMAERDLLIMGRAAKPYLDEQRAKASPELQGAIDRIWQQILDEDR